MKPDISLEAHVRYLAAPSAAAGLIIVIVLFLLTRISAALSMPAFALLSAATLAGLWIEIALWQARGTHLISLSGRTLTLYRGRKLEPRIVERREVERARFRPGWGQKTLTLTLGSGERIRLSSQAFREEEFTRLLEALADW